LAISQGAEEGTESVKRFWIFDPSASFRTGFGFWIADKQLRITNKSVHILLIVIIAGWLTAAVSLAGGENLPKIKSAPEFTLTKQDGKRFALKELRGKVLAITFIFASCADTCPLLTAKMAGIQNHLGSDFGQKVHFVSITVDPERDTPAVLKRYAEAHKANPAGWAFLTGTQAEIRAVAKRYGIFYKKTSRGDVDHTFLTSLVDQSGTLRVQYMGVNFNPDEMLRDLQSLLEEGKTR
jgi:protein SCO1